MQVALSINARNEAEARNLALRAARIVSQDGIIHIDVCDGAYTQNASWGDASCWRAITPKGIKTEVHLMARDWEARLVPWLHAGAFRIIVPVDVIGVDEATRAREVAARYGAELMLSVSLADAILSAVSYVGFGAFQILAVPTGRSGQQFNEGAIKKIKALRAAMPNAILEVDGGMTPLNAARAGEAGADIIVSSSYIWNAENPHEAYQSLLRI